MKYRKLGKTGLMTSVVGIGTWQFGGEWGKDFAQPEVDQIFDRARDLGLNLIDTAECYGDHTSERLIGSAIQRDREKWIVATKFGHKFISYMNRIDTRTPETVREELEASLKSLRTDYIDIYQYHSWGDDQFFKDDVQAELEKHMTAGKIRHLGNSVGKNDNVKQVAASEQKNIEVIQIIHNRLDRTPENTTFPICIQQNLGVLARVPLASGLLTGKYKPGHKFPQGDVRSTRDQAKIDELLREVERVQKEEVPPEANLATWALAWCLQHPAVSAVIPGVKDVHQLESNAAAADLDIVSTDHPQAWKTEQATGARSPADP
jgi:aryl-alcohol dehydrogenase-like predicted oxidoreductase